MNKRELSDLAEVVYGKSPSGFRTERSTYPLYGTGGVVGYATRAMFDVDAVVLPRKGSLGNPWFARAGFWAIDTTYVATPRDGVDAKWLYYALSSFDLTKLNEATGVPSISRDWLRKLVIPTPNLDEQRRIADLLSAVDEQIAQVEYELEKIITLRSGVIRKALARLSGAPLEPLERLADVGSGITLGRQFSGPGTADYPYLRVANVQDGHIDLTDVKSLRLPESVAAKARLEPGDVLMNEGGDFDKLGRGAVWHGQIPNCLHQNHVFRVRCNQELLLPDFLALWAASDFGKRFFMLASKQSTNLASINSTQLKKFPVLRLNLDEQREVLQVADALSSALELGKREAGKLRLLKQGLAQDLLRERAPASRIN